MALTSGFSGPIPACAAAANISSSNSCRIHTLSALLKVVENLTNALQIGLSNGSLVLHKGTMVGDAYRGTYKKSTNGLR